MDVKIIPLWTEPIIRSIIYQIRLWNFLTFWLNQTAKRKQFLVIRRPMLHGKFKSQYTLSISSSFLLLLSPSLEKWETPRYHESKISESRQSFLIQPDGHFHFRTTDKKPMGCRSVPFFLPYLQDQGLLWSKSFATMATWRNNVSSRFLIAHCIFFVFFCLLVSSPLMYDLVWDSGRLKQVVKVLL